MAYPNPTTYTLPFTGTKIRVSSRRRFHWVMTLSGDEGGTYDYCPDNPTTSEYDDDKKHEVAR